MSLARRLVTTATLFHFDNAWHLLAQRLCFSRDRLTSYRLGALEVIADWSAGDHIGVHECLAGKIYTDLLRRLALPPTLRCLDIGAHVGAFSLLLAHLGHRPTYLTAIEVNPRTLATLRFNLAHNLPDCDRRVRHVAAWSEAGTIEFRPSPGSTGDSLMRPNAPDAPTAIVVPTATLDDLIETDFGDTPIDLLKIDIEGAEYPVLYGPHTRLLDRCQHLVIEIHPHPDHDPDALLAHLGTRGFDVVASHQHGTERIVALRHRERAR